MKGIGREQDGLYIFQPSQTVLSPKSASTLDSLSPDSPIISPSITQPLRRTSRLPKQPQWIQDYVCSNQSSASSIDTEAVLDSRWVDAMKQEIRALEENDTWEVVSLPQGKVPIGCKWVYRIKYQPDGSIERFKARLVGKCFR